MMHKPENSFVLGTLDGTAAQIDMQERNKRIDEFRAQELAKKSSQKIDSTLTK